MYKSHLSLSRKLEITRRHGHHGSVNSQRHALPIHICLGEDRPDPSAPRPLPLCLRKVKAGNRFLKIESQISPG